MTVHIKKQVQIQDGCKLKCTFCARPTVDKGNETFFPPDQILAELQGCFEVQLIGPNICAYNYNGINLIQLIKMILNKYPRIKIELNNILPHSPITKELLQLVRDEPRMAKFINLSVQSGCNATLERMGLSHKVEDIDELLHPELFYGFHMILGFPGETEEEFNQTYENAKRWVAKYNNITFFDFAYFDKPESGAFNFPDKIEQSVIEDRVNKMNSITFNLRIVPFFPQMSFVSLVDESSNTLMINDVSINEIIDDNYDMNKLNDIIGIIKPIDYISYDNFIKFCEKIKKQNPEFLKKLIHNSSANSYCFKDRRETYEDIIFRMINN